MNRFSRTEHDPEAVARAAMYNARAKVLIGMGHITDDQHKACRTLADVVNLVQAGETAMLEAQDERAERITTPLDGIRAHLAKQAARRAKEDAAPDLHGNAFMLNMWFNFFNKNERPDLARAVVTAGDMTPELHEYWLAYNKADNRRSYRLSSPTHF